MEKLSRVLRSQRGDLLLESLLGSVVIALIMSAAGTVLVAALAAATGNSFTTGRMVLLNTVLSDSKPTLTQDSTIPQSLIRTSNGENVTVFLWRQDITPTLSVLHAATNRSTASPSDCADPATLSAVNCLSSQASSTTSSSGIAVTPVALTAGSGGTLYTFTAPAGATELRYVFKVTDASSDSKLTFNNLDKPGTAFDVKIPSGTTGYFYGRILVNAGSQLSITTTGPASYDSSAFLIYEAP